MKKILKILFYDCEIKTCIPGKWEYYPDPRYKYCGGWDDFENMGIACIAIYANWRSYDVFLKDQLGEFQKLVDEADEIVGFNSISFDDKLMAANGVQVRTTYDLLCEIRVAAGMPPHYVKGVTRGGYNLDQISYANLGRRKTGTGELAPQLWQDGKHEEVIGYCLNDVDLLVDLWKRRSHLIDPTNGNILFLRGGNQWQWLKKALNQWLRKTKAHWTNEWNYSHWRVFLWAIMHSDVSGCQIRLTTRMRNWVRVSNSGIEMQLAFPQLGVDLTDQVLDDFHRKTGDQYFGFPF